MDNDNITVVYVMSPFFLDYLKLSLETIPRHVPVILSWISPEAFPESLLSPRVKVLKLASPNRAFNRSRALNAAIREATTEWVIIADADMLFPSFFFKSVSAESADWKTIRRFFIGRFDPLFTARILQDRLNWERALAMYSGIRMWSPSEVSPLKRAMTRVRNFLLPATRGATYGQAKDYEGIYASGNPSLYSRRLLFELGGYDESLEGWGGEEQDLYQRGIRIGVREKRLPIIVGHLHHPAPNDFQNYNWKTTRKRNLAEDRPTRPVQGI